MQAPLSGYKRGKGCSDGEGAVVTVIAMDGDELVLVALSKRDCAADEVFYGLRMTLSAPPHAQGTRQHLISWDAST